MDRPTLDDLSVSADGSDKDLDHYTVSSWLTRGRCAEVAVSRNDPSRIHVRPFLIPSYMQGITESLIVAAVRAHIQARAGARGHEYVPSKPLLTLEDMPEAIRPHAQRALFAGTGYQYAPRVYGWVVFSHGGPHGGVAYDAEARTWLKARGFKHGGRRWHLRDDVACGENAFDGKN